MNGTEGRGRQTFGIDRYPKNVLIDFRKLNGQTLRNYVQHYNLSVRPTASQEELAVLVARHFELETKAPKEEEAITSFLVSYDGATGKALGFEPPSRRLRHQGIKRSTTDVYGPAKEGEQVAARIEGDDAGWILATVRKYHASSDEFEVQDEDDDTKLIRLTQDRVIRLDDSLDGLQKGDSVLAVFPDTTAFYRGRISKPVKHRSAPSGADSAIYVQFEDDEDETGRLPHRKVPAKFVMADPDDEVANGDEPLIEFLFYGPNGVQYADLIAYALRKTPQGQGSLNDVCDILQEDFSEHLSPKDDDKPNQWRTFVRRTLLSPPLNAEYRPLDGSRNLFTIVRD